MHNGNGLFTNDQTRVIVDERNKRASVNGIVIANVQIITRDRPKTFEQMAEDARKKLKALKGKIVRLNSPQGDWVLYEKDDDFEIYFEKTPSGNRNARNLRVIAFTDKTIPYPVWIASQRTGSTARANAKVSHIEFNCNEATYHLRRLQFLGGSLNRLSDLASYVENDPIFSYNVVFTAISQQMGGYRLNQNASQFWIDSYAFACMN
jgi:tricorn protease-like protein